jgi:hypothetical protein
MNIDPPPHNGLNVWILSTARKFAMAGRTMHEAESAIRSYQGSTRRPMKTSEITRALEKAFNTQIPASYSGFSERLAGKPKWQPSKTRQTAYKKSNKGITAYDLWEMSPDRIDDGMTQMMILQMLFPDPAGLVCVGKSAYEFHTARLNQFKDLTKCQFIVPCYMSKQKGLTQDGKESMHCLDNCGERRYHVCDFDEPKSADHPGIVLQLKRTFDLVMALSSGGKSLHAWFNVAEDEDDSFWQAAIEYGADPVLMRNRSSFVRMPMGTRDSGARQNVVYFDQSKLKP